MDPTTNGIQSELGASMKSPIEVANLTKFQPDFITTQITPLTEHVATTDLRDIHDFISRLGYGDCKSSEYSIFQVKCQIHSFKVYYMHCFVDFPFFSSIGCGYTNHAMCNSDWYVTVARHWILIHSPNTKLFSAHTDPILGKDINAMRCLHNHWFSRFSVVNCVSCVRILWFCVPFRVFTMRLPIFHTFNRLCGRWSEFHKEIQRTNGFQHTNTATLLLSTIFTTNCHYKVSNCEPFLLLCSVFAHFNIHCVFLVHLIGTRSGIFD